MPEERLTEARTSEPQSLRELNTEVEGSKFNRAEALDYMPVLRVTM